MTTVAVTGTGGPVAAALLARLDADPRVDRLVGIGLDEPSMPPGTLSQVVADPRGPLPPEALAGVDVVVDLAEPSGPRHDEDAAFARDVSGARHLLAAAEEAGVTRLVHLSSAAVYGAHPDNPVPLTEDCPLRANPDFPWAYHHLLAEELVADWGRRHPKVTVVVLRPATILSADGAAGRHLAQPVLPLVRGTSPPVQLLDVDDLVAALHLAVCGDLRGAYNVAADGWLTTADLAALLGRPRLEVGEVVAAALARRLWAAGITEGPPGALAYVMYPWVVSSARLHAAGWAPSRSNREILRAFAEQQKAYVTVGRVRLRRVKLYAVAGAACTASLVTAAGVLWAWARRRRTTRRACR